MKKIIPLFLLALILISCKQADVSPEDPTPQEVKPEVVSPKEFWNSSTSYHVPEQPSIHGTREQNNKIIWKHINDTMYKFDIKNALYLEVYTKKEIACNRDLFIGINGKTLGVVHKNSNCEFISDPFKEYVEYTFSIESIEIISNGKKQILNLHDYADGYGYINLSFAIGESKNYVTFIQFINS